MDYIEKNKEAWEEAFGLRKGDWGKNILEKLEADQYPYLEPDLTSVLEEIGIKEKCFAHFCCNDGRELLAIVKNGATRGVGFDIAQNMISYANINAQKANINCEFIATDILQIDTRYDNSFDVVITTVGALNWFKDLNDFFKVAARLLKEDGQIVIQETHPLANMLAYEDEDNYDPTNPLKIVNSYFKNDEWISESGMSYLAGESYQSKQFIDYSHTLEEIICALANNNIYIVNLKESSKDLGGGLKAVTDKGIPLSMIIQGKKL